MNELEVGTPGLGLPPESWRPHVCRHSGAARGIAVPRASNLLRAVPGPAGWPGHRFTR